MERIFIERKKLLNWIVPYHLCARTTGPCLMQQHSHFWVHLLDSNKGNVNGGKSEVWYKNFVMRFHKKHNGSKITNKHHPSLLPCWQPIWGGLPIPGKIKGNRSIENIQILHNGPQCLLITNLVDSEHQPHWQLPETLYIIHWHPRPYCLQDLL